MIAFGLLDADIGFVIPKQSGGFVMGLDKTVSEFNWGSNEYKVLAEVEQGKETRFNDAKCDSSGRLLCGMYCAVVKVGVQLQIMSDNLF